jgi:hypothetical protein
MRKTLTLLLITLTTTTFGATCKNAKDAIKIIRILEQTETKLGKLATSEIAEAKNEIANGEFCGGVLAHIKAVSLCTVIAVEGSWFTGGASKLTANSQRNQKKLDRALLNYGKYFVSSEEDNKQLNCDLKTFEFPTI